MTPSKALSHYKAASMPDPDATPTSSECLPLTASDLDLRMDAIRAHKPVTVPEAIKPGFEYRVEKPFSVKCNGVDVMRVSESGEITFHPPGESDERDDSEPPLWPLLLSLTVVGMALGSFVTWAVIGWFK